MQQVKTKKDMQSNGSAMLIQHKMSKEQKQMPQEDDKNCPSIKNVKSKDLNSQSTVRKCSDQKCQKICSQ